VAALNLVYNAIEASPRGGAVQLASHLRSSVRGHPEAALEVRDQGAGISPERLPRIFDAFRSTKRTGAHVGMGLPNVHRIVTAHGGNVTVSSEVGKGSVFVIALPVTEPDELGKAVGLEPKKA
jgi:two-component system NtrC family sensor kinase